MSVDTTVVIAARHVATEFSHDKMVYTADVVQAVENLIEEHSRRLEIARKIFVEKPHPWFVTLPLAKQYANLLAQNERLQGTLEYDNRPIIEITEDRVYLLSKKGGRLKQTSWL